MFQGQSCRIPFPSPPSGLRAEPGRREGGLGRHTAATGRALREFVKSVPEGEWVGGGGGVIVVGMAD